jgi:Trypsin-like peptidase domain
MHGIILLLLVAFIGVNEAKSQIISQGSLKHYSYKIQGVNTNTKKLVNGGTAFIFTYMEHDFLVTNYHVLTGKNASTDQKIVGLSDTCNAVLIWFRDEKVDTVKKALIPIYDSLGERLFSIYHVDAVRLFDIAVLPLFPEQYPPAIKTYTITERSIDTLTYNKTGVKVFIPGFPRGTSEPTIKSAVSVKQQMHGDKVTPLIFFSDSTLPGMSGSPIWRITGNAKHAYLIGVNASNPTSGIENPKTQGAGVYFKYAMALIKEMIRRDRINIDLHYTHH